LKPIGIRLDEATVKYIDDLAAVFEERRSTIIRQLVKAAVELHQKGIIELSTVIINYDMLKKSEGEQK
jgi:predicted transcriptional regulator